MTRVVIVESCVDSLPAAIASAEGGASRIELCANLDAGGTTPDPALVAQVVAAVPIPVVAMARARGGAFVYDAHEADALVRDVAAMRAAGAHGVVTGALRADRTIDEALMTRAIAAAGRLPVTCHKAFDETADLDAALDTLLSLGVWRVLTSGGASTAAEGAGVLARLVRRAAGRIGVLAGGHVRASNVGALLEATGVREVHARIIREPAAGADARMRQRWRDDVAALVAAARQSGSGQHRV